MGDFLAFRRMITPLVIQVIFWIGVVITVIAGIGQIVMGLNSYGGGAAVLSGIIMLFVGPLIVRVYCELIILLFRIYDELVAMRTGKMPGAPGFPVIQQ